MNLFKLLEKEAKLLESLDEYDWKINYCDIDDDETQMEYNKCYSKYIDVKQKIVKAMRKELKRRKEFLQYIDN